MKKIKNNKGITLIALIITIIILLILAGVAISFSIGNDGIFNKSKKSAEKYNEESVKERLEIALADCTTDKYTNEEYNQEDYLTQKLEEAGFIVTGDIVSDGKYFFTIDRSVPKIGESIGQDDLENILIITNEEELKDFRDKVNAGEDYEGKTVMLGNNIELAGNDANNWTEIGNNGHWFKGTFIGNGHTISNINMQTTGNVHGFFKVNYGTIKNLTLKGEMNGDGATIAGICGQNYGKIENCNNYINVNNSTTTQYLTGGITAELWEGTIKNCNNYGDITTGFNGAGGIVGRTGKIANGNGGEFEISNCINCGEILVKGNVGAGGIVGYTESGGVIKNCINENTVTLNGGAGAGGILGTQLSNNKNKVTIQECINNSKIYGGVWSVGGIVGDVANVLDVLKCKNTKEVSAGNGNCGGIVGNVGGNDDTIFTTNVFSCVNLGYIHSEGKAGGPNTGGIIGCIQFGDNASILNCYNTGNIKSTTSNYNAGIGGIVGGLYKNNTVDSSKITKATITNCYNKGDIEYPSNNYAGQIVGRDDNNLRSITNCYYLKTAKGSGTLGGNEKTAEQLKTLASELNSEEFEDTADGPILKWETE